MELTVLGKSPSWQDRNGACSGYLLRQGGFTLLLDCGSGVFAKLRSACDYRTVDAILLSHLHPDHFLDLVPYSFALNYGPSSAGARPELHAPPGAVECFRRLGSTWGDERQIEQTYRLTEYDPGQPPRIGPFEVRFCEVPHFVQAFAVDLRAGGRRLTFGADCGPNEALAAFADGTDLLLVEATQAEPGEGPRGHMTAFEAGETGRRAGAGRILITHFSDELDEDRILAEAQRGYGATVTLAHEGSTIEV